MELSFLGISRQKHFRNVMTKTCHGMISRVLFTNAYSELLRRGLIMHHKIFKYLEEPGEADGK